MRILSEYLPSCSANFINDPYPDPSRHSDPCSRNADHNSNVFGSRCGVDPRGGGSLPPTASLLASRAVDDGFNAT